MKIRALLAVLVTAVTAFAATSAAGAQNQSGLVNVAVVDNTVQIPIGIAANVCDVSANILSSGTLTGPADCTAVSNAFAYSSGGNGGGGGNQQGLINLYVADNTIQVPVAVAANVCDIAVNVLASATATGPAHCDATGNAGANG
jgi:hypothetical protein